MTLCGGDRQAVSVAMIGPTFQRDRFHFRLEVEPDLDAGCPWENRDTLGRVTEWVRRDKGPGERVLDTDRHCRRFYDFAGAVAKARRTEGLKGPEAVHAMESEWAYLKSWCDNQWQYVGVIVTLLDIHGDLTQETDAIWCVDDDIDRINALAIELALGIGQRVGDVDVLITEKRLR